MEEQFPEDIDLDEEPSPSNEGGDYATDYDNQKLFTIYETYLNKADISDTESEPDLSLSDEFFKTFDQKVTKTPVTNRTVQRISCLADIESRTPRMPRKSGLTDVFNDSAEESFIEPTLPWNLNEMSEQQIVEVINDLDEEISHKEKQYPNLSAKHMKEIYDKQIEIFSQAFENSENHFQNCLQRINARPLKDRLAFDELIGKELANIKANSEQLKKLGSDLTIIQKLSSQ